MLVIEHAGFEITVQDEPTYRPGSADNARRYAREVPTCAATAFHSRHGITVTNKSTRYTTILLGCGGPSTVHARTAVPHGDRLFVACGDAVCALTLPGLEPAWLCRAGDATCLGLHLLPDRSGVISHGELPITRLSLDGEVIWRAWGRDIFSGDVAVLDDRVRAVDWNGAVYEIALDDGRILNRDDGR